MKKALPVCPMPAEMKADWHGMADFGRTISDLGMMNSRRIRTPNPEIKNRQSASFLYSQRKPRLTPFGELHE
ncbi:MAG: hypothetical protein KDA92_02625 [Planctomycetales bacterium]|nr:hypothetical protein [Planctomycetales bacterium]